MLLFDSLVFPSLRLCYHPACPLDCRELVCMFVCLPACLAACLSGCLSVCIPVCLFVCLCVSLLVCLERILRGDFVLSSSSAQRIAKEQTSPMHLWRASSICWNWGPQSRAIYLATMLPGCLHTMCNLPPQLSTIKFVFLHPMSRIMVA